MISYKTSQNIFVFIYQKTRKSNNDEEQAFQQSNTSDIEQHKKINSYVSVINKYTTAIWHNAKKATIAFVFVYAIHIYDYERKFLLHIYILSLNK